jgi:hypothetical protein
VQIKGVLSFLPQIAAILDMYRNFLQSSYGQALLHVWMFCASTRVTSLATTQCRSHMTQFWVYITSNNFPPTLLFRSGAGFAWKSERIAGSKFGHVTHGPISFFCVNACISG